MTNEKLLKTLKEMVLLLNEEDLQSYNFAMNHPTENFIGCSFFGMRFAALVNIVQNEIYENEAKKLGKKATLQAAKRILKNIRISNEALRYAKTRNGKQYICDGVAAVVLNTPIKSLPECPDTLLYPDINALIPKFKDTPLTLPNLASLKAYVKIKKAKKEYDSKHNEIFYDFGDNLPLVNAEYLINVLDLLGDCRAMVARGMLYFESENGVGVLCGIHPLEGYIRHKTEI